MYTQFVDFEWDPRKSDANLVERGFDLEFATLIFEGRTLEREDRRREYGECRMVAIGRANGVCLTVIYTDRHPPSNQTIRRVISARRSNRRERFAYEEAIKREASR
jgi:uncharacterized DUF497 family protein